MRSAPELTPPLPMRARSRCTRLTDFPLTPISDAATVCRNLSSGSGLPPIQNQMRQLHGSRKQTWRTCSACVPKLIMGSALAGVDLRGRLPMRQHRCWEHARGGDATGAVLRSPNGGGASCNGPRAQGPGELGYPQEEPSKIGSIAQGPSASAMADDFRRLFEPRAFGPPTTLARPRPPERRPTETQEPVIVLSRRG